MSHFVWNEKKDVILNIHQGIGPLMRGPFIVNAGSHQEDVFPCMPTFFDVKVISEQREECTI